jgi:nucleoside-diphosphate-sugar epimerase
VLVTGGAGYLGAILVRRLLANGYIVRVLDALLYGEVSLAELRKHPRFELVTGDLRDASVLESSVHGCETVVHLAAIVGDRACERNYDLARSVNAVATHRLVCACRRQNVRRFLFASTCSVYGVSSDIVDENSVVNPVSHYAECKVAAERLVLDAASDCFHPTVLRLATLFGSSPRPRFDLLVNLLTARAVCEGRIRILNGTQWRPFAHVADVARAFEICMEADVSSVSGQVLNVGDCRQNLQLHRLAQVINQLIPSVEIICEENNDPRSYRPSFKKIQASLDFCCERSIENGVVEIHHSLTTGNICNFRDARYWNERALEQVVSIACARKAGVEQVGAHNPRMSVKSHAAAS